MVAVMFMLAVLVIALAAAAPRVKDSIQREREVETMQRGKQYIRAVQLYYRKFHAYPPNIDALVKTQEIRFLRKKYLDPTTGKEEWKPIQFGQNKAPTAMGFFGQPLGGSAIAGIGPGGGNGLTNPGAAGSTDPSGQGGLSPQTTSGSIFNSNGSGSSILSSGASNGIGAAASDPNGGNGGNGAGGPGNGTGGQTLGGAGIIGFSPQSPKQSILVYKKKNHYNEWEFVYDPLADQMTIGSSGAGSGAQPINGTGGAFGNPPGFGNSPNQPGIGNSPVPPVTGVPPTPAPTPTQPPTPAPQQ